jgi:hypothetical protein
MVTRVHQLAIHGFSIFLRAAIAFANNVPTFIVFVFYFLLFDYLAIHCFGIFLCSSCSLCLCARLRLRVHLVLVDLTNKDKNKIKIKIKNTKFARASASGFTKPRPRKNRNKNKIKNKNKNTIESSKYVCLRFVCASASTLVGCDVVMVWRRIHTHVFFQMTLAIIIMIRVFGQLSRFIHINMKKIILMIIIIRVLQTPLAIHTHRPPYTHPQIPFTHPHLRLHAHAHAHAPPPHRTHKYIPTPTHPQTDTDTKIETDTVTLNRHTQTHTDK